jgi:hypothetical protein
MCEEQLVIMTETVPTRPFDELEALAWLRSQPQGAVTASAAELGRRWGWNRMRTGRRLKAWEKAGLIRRNAEAIIATTPVTSTVTDVTPTVSEAVSVTLMPETAVTRRSMMSVRLAAFIVALALAYRQPFLLMASPQSLPARSGPSSLWAPRWKPASSWQRHG